MRAIIEKGMKMREVKVLRSVLLEKVRENREKHIKDYHDACEGYKAQAIQRIDEVMGDIKSRIERLRQGQVIELVAVSFGLNVPRSHEKDYDQVIAMLQMSVDDTLTVRSDEFACYVMDDWEWKAEWTHSNSMYMSK